MKIAVIGAGAVGGYFGARLVEAGHEVSFVARGATLEALRDRGLRIESPLGDLELADLTVSDRTSSIDRVDAVIVGVKAWQVHEVAPSIRPLLGNETCVLPLQNGVEAPDQLASALGAEAVVGGVCKIICKLVERGHVRHFGAEPAIDMGELDGRRSARLERLGEALTEARVKVRVRDDVRVAMWEKFLFITAVSGVGAVTRATLGEQIALEETRGLLEQAMVEVAAVAAAHGVELAGNVVERTMGFLARLPADATASMQRDIMAGRRSELEAQNGGVVRLAAQVGVDVPLHRFLYSSLLPMERQARA